MPSIGTCSIDSRPPAFLSTVNLYESHTGKDHFRVTCTCKHWDGRSAASRTRWPGYTLKKTTRHCDEIRLLSRSIASIADVSSSCPLRALICEHDSIANYRITSWNWSFLLLFIVGLTPWLTLETLILTNNAYHTSQLGIFHSVPSFRLRIIYNS